MAGPMAILADGAAVETSVAAGCAATTAEAAAPAAFAAVLRRLRRLVRLAAATLVRL